MRPTVTSLDGGPRNRLAKPRSKAVHGMVKSAHQESKVQSQSLVLELGRRHRRCIVEPSLDFGKRLECDHPPEADLRSGEPW